jgi:hypothetical protein
MTAAESVAAACRVLAATGLVEHVLGHVSARTGTDRLVVRCRGPRESGLAWTTERDVREVPLDGRPDVAPWAVPNELPIHRVLLRRRDDVTAVVHAHPPAVVTYSLLDRPVLPVYGAYDIPGAALAAGGGAGLAAGGADPHRRAGRRDDGRARRPPGRAAAWARAGQRRGWTGADRGAAGGAAGARGRHAGPHHARRAAGRRYPTAIDEADLAELPDLGAGFTVETMWRHLLRRLDT